MHYEGDIIRPPSEAGSIILQVTVGCSHNACAFCGAYRSKTFRIKERAVIEADIDFAARYCRRQTTLFLADGNALALPPAELTDLLRAVSEKLPWVRRVGLYANARDILGYPPGGLRELRKMGLGRIYMGLESGHDPTLRIMAKGADAAEMIRAGRMVREAGIFLSVTVLLGVAGIDHSREHALATARVLNEMGPSQVAVLTLMILDNTPLARRVQTGSFVQPDANGLLGELATIVEKLDIRCQFQANHASNYLSLDGRLPKDKRTFLSSIEEALSGKLTLKPEHCRSL
ncbi:MAG: radical SAM protein [Desulfobulbaceae bacterium]